ncbi:hypothetical protein J2792_001727 [Novosphingobium capsulatum]|uniref:Uncharacterized protein n=1 Tax=Novosphingobium capsulatum TaxID=13688 RepID=A0ABU1MLF2_9SPHN|nr:MULTISPECIES: hypothetical protein [Novosphingobium]MDR6510861.1 hypothetical protein [Novosphingobium capsulatum]
MSFMDQRAFVDLLQLVVLDRLSVELVKTWQNPPGRLRSEERSRRSGWMKNLSGPERALVEEFGQDAARAAVFGVLCVLDGVRKIEDRENGHIELHHVKNGRSELLASSGNDMTLDFLHDLLP